ncbi:MAG: AsmA family protein, partial [Bacteroidaceae bacterium]|nr:AsmA family protein [Bacteroidaceae bacterium]
MSETSKSSGKLLRVCAVAFLSLLALVVLAVLVLSWTIFTPSRLTKTAQSVMDRYVNCPTSLGQAKLSLVRTYPFLGFRLENLTALDVMEESPYDTLAHVGIMDVSLDFKALTKDRRIEVTDLFLQNAAFNMFTSETGTTNLDFLKSGDSDSTDSSGSMDLSVSLESLVLEDFAARYADQSKGLEAQATGLDMKAAGSM